MQGRKTFNQERCIKKKDGLMLEIKKVLYRRLFPVTFEPHHVMHKMLQLSSGLRGLTLLLTSINFSSALPHRPQSQQFTRDGIQLPRLDKRASKQDYVAYAVAGIDQMQTW